MSDPTGSVRPAHLAISIGPAQPDDRAGMMDVAASVGLFGPDELADVERMLAAYLDGTAETDHHWLVGDLDGAAVALAYYAPERMTSGTWNLYLIAIHPDHQRYGHGAAILDHVERGLKARGERILLIETAGIESFEPQRAFYRSRGYEEEACIREFYAPGTDKIVFRKAL